MSWPRSNPRAWVSVLLWVAVVMLCSQGCLCRDLWPHDRGAPNLATVFDRESLEQQGSISALTGMSLQEELTTRKLYFDDWDYVTWVNKDSTIIPAWHDSVAVDGWINLTNRKKKLSYTGHYRMDITSGVNSPDPSAGFGFGGSAWSEASNLRMLEKLALPNAPAGVTAILPGQCVKGVFKEDGPTVYRYLVSLPPNRKGIVNDSELNRAYEICILNENKILPLLDYYGEVKPSYQFGKYFDTGMGGEFIIEVSPLPYQQHRPMAFLFQAYWGATGSGACRDDTAPSPETDPDTGIISDT